MEMSWKYSGINILFMQTVIKINMETVDAEICTVLSVNVL